MKRTNEARMAVTAGMVLLAGACSSKPPVASPDPKGAEVSAASAQAGPEASKAAETKEAAVEASLKAALAREAGSQPVRSQVLKGPSDTRIVKAHIEGAYPGSGVRSVVMDAEGVTYGAHGQRDLAELVRARGWLTTPPPVADYVVLVNAAQFETMLAMAPDSPPRLTPSPDGLLLELERVSFPSQGRDRVAVHVPTDGPLSVKTGPVADAKPVDKVQALHDALADGDAMKIDGAIARLSGDARPEALAALAKASTLANDNLAASALGAIGTSAEAAGALKEAWKDVPAERRSVLVDLARELHGADFAKQLK